MPARISQEAKFVQIIVDWAMHRRSCLLRVNFVDGSSTKGSSRLKPDFEEESA
jgi:hypothetical protein